jgi:hypothetical protein
MTGLLEAMTTKEIGAYPREGWVNVNDSLEVREFLSNLPYEQLIKIEAFRQQAEANGQMDLFNQWLNKLMISKE